MNSTSIQQQTLPSGSVKLTPNADAGMRFITDLPLCQTRNSEVVLKSGNRKLKNIDRYYKAVAE